MSTVAPVTCFVVTRAKPVVRNPIGSGQTVELSSGRLCILLFFYWAVQNNKFYKSLFLLLCVLFDIFFCPPVWRILYNVIFSCKGNVFNKSPLLTT